MSEQTKHKISSIAFVLVVLIGAITIITVIGLINNNFFPKKVPVTVEITKSPFRIIYRGEKIIPVNEIVKDVKDIPFANYKFNTETNINIDTHEATESSSSSKIDLSEKTSNTSNTTANETKIGNENKND